MKTRQLPIFIACALLSMVCMGCSSPVKNDWRISEIQKAIDDSQIQIKHIVAIRILDDNQLEVITQEGGPLAGGGVNITMTRKNGVWIIEKTEGFDS